MSLLIETNPWMNSSAPSLCETLSIRSLSLLDEFFSALALRGTHHQMSDSENCEPTRSISCSGRHKSNSQKYMHIEIENLIFSAPWLWASLCNSLFRIKVTTDVQRYPASSAGIIGRPTLVDFPTLIVVMTGRTTNVRKYPEPNSLQCWTECTTYVGIPILAFQALRSACHARSFDTLRRSFGLCDQGTLVFLPPSFQEMGYVTNVRRHHNLRQFKYRTDGDHLQLMWKFESNLE